MGNTFSTAENQAGGPSGGGSDHTAGRDAPLVLLVESNATMRRMLRVVLEAQDYIVVEAVDARRALHLVDRHVPQLILQDLHLPDMDGLLAAEQLQQRMAGRHVPIVGLANRADGLDELRAARVGLAAVLFKPVETNHLLRVIQASLNRPELVPRPEASPCARRSAMKSAQLHVLTRISEVLATHGTVQSVLGECVAACVDVAGILGGALYLVDGERGELRLEHQQGFALAQLESCDPGAHLLGEACRTRQVMAIPSLAVAQDAGDRLLRELGVGSALIAPLAWTGQVYGGLLLGARADGLLAADALAFAELIATHLAQALALSQSLQRLSVVESRYRAIMDHANDIVCMIDEQGFILESNRGFEVLTGRTAEQIIGKHITDFDAPGHGESNLHKFADALARGISKQEVQLQAADGTPASISFSCSVIEIDGRRIVLTVGRDVTEQQRIQAQLMVSDRMASVGMLAAGVAHEINNPLAAVLANLELATKDAIDLQRRPGAASELVEELMDAREGADRVREIVRDLKIFSRAEEDKQGAVDIHRVLDSSARMAWNELRHHAHLVKSYGQVPAVTGNESRLGQVFLNLIVNAAQAIPEGHADDHEIRLTTSVESGRVIVEVRDSGPGMPPEVLRRLFTPFFTTKPVGIGTGLGLSICQRIVTGVGGEIRVDSQVGQGTTFKIILPAAEGPVLKSTTPTPTVPASQQRGRVLIVDDDALVVRLMHRLLTSDHDVTTVASAQGAIDLVQAGEWFDVVLCDVMMPHLNGMDLHAALKIRAPLQAERMIFVTGGAFTPRAREFLDAVPNQRVDKPFDPAGLCRLVNERVGAGKEY